MSSLSNLVLPLVAFGGAVIVTKWFMKRWLLSGLHEVYAHEDGGVYYVVPGPHTMDAANSLARLRRSLMKVYTKAITSPPPQQQMLRDGLANLKSRYAHPEYITVYELDSTRNDDIAFNQNKRDGIFICIRKDLNTMEIADDETLLHIGVHELAHSMQSHSAPLGSNGETRHDAEFDAFNQLLKAHAIDLGLLGGFDMTRTTHCGKIIT
jgi:hypothetical protein